MKIDSGIKEGIYFTSWLSGRLFLLLLFLGFGRATEHHYLEDYANSIQDLVAGASTTIRPLSCPFITSSPGLNNDALVACNRLRIRGLSRFRNICKYAHSCRVKVHALVPSSKIAIPKIEVCFHWNESYGICQCPKDQWKALEKGQWMGMMSPFETRFIDIRATEFYKETPLNISVVEEFWPHRLCFLVGGLLLLLIAPIVSSWVPFYYSSAMTLGILLVILILLYQGMKLLPTGRKSTLYIILYGSVVGMGTVIMHYFSGMVSSVLKEFGFSDEIYNPVALFVLVSIILMGAWLGFWGVRKLVLSEDGTVDYGTAQFVKWAIRLIGAIMILQSSQDTLFALLALVAGIVLTWVFRTLPLWDPNFWDSCSLLWPEYLNFSIINLIQNAMGRKPFVNHAQAKFMQRSDALLLKSQTNALHRSPLVSSHGTVFKSPSACPSPSSPSNQQDFYSSFHKTPERKLVSSAEWDNLTKECTKKAINELVTSPKFSEWVINHSDRIMITPNEHRDERVEEEIEMTATMGEHVSNSRRLLW